MDTAEGMWTGWNWRTEGDLMVNGAYFVPSGEGLEDIYGKASSTDPKSSALVDTLTQNAGVFGDPRYPPSRAHLFVADFIHSMRARGPLGVAVARARHNVSGADAHVSRAELCWLEISRTVRWGHMNDNH